jgi:hypothetical protein
MEPGIIAMKTAAISPADRWPLTCSKENNHLIFPERKQTDLNGHDSGNSHLFCEEVGDYRCIRRKKWSQENADILQLNGWVKKAQCIMNENRCCHEPRMDGSANGTSERVPILFIEPKESRKHQREKAPKGAPGRVEFRSHLSTTFSQNTKVEYQSRNA